MQIPINSIIKNYPDCQFYGNENSEIGLPQAINQLTIDSNDAICWLEANKYLDIEQLSFGLLILNEQSHTFHKNKEHNFLVSATPKLTYLDILQKHYAQTVETNAAHKSIVHETAKVGNNCILGNNVVVEENVVIGNDCQIMHNSTIKANTVIGNNVIIGSNCSLGTAGFNYDLNAEGQWITAPAFGNVLIKDGARLYNNVNIDAPIEGQTVLGAGIKIASNVVIEGGANIGENTLINTNCSVGRNVVIQPNCWLAQGTVVRENVVLAVNTFTGIGAGVVRNSNAGELLFGNPAQVIKKRG